MNSDVIELPLWKLFAPTFAERKSPVVVEIGTKAWNGNPSRSLRDWVASTNPSATYTGIDYLPGDGVDRVVDAHELSLAFGRESIDVVLLPYVLEHVRRPWVVGMEIARSLKVGGDVYCVTHQSFPIHNFPNDYFRFSADALMEIFSGRLGFDTITKYSQEVQIMPTNLHAGVWDYNATGWARIESVSTKARPFVNAGQWCWS